MTDVENPTHYGDYGRALLTLQESNAVFSTPRAQWENLSVVDYVAQQLFVEVLAHTRARTHTHARMHMHMHTYIPTMRESNDVLST